MDTPPPDLPTLQPTPPRIAELDHLGDQIAELPAHLEDGLHVPAGTSQRLACDASRVVMRHDEDGRVVEVGARVRHAAQGLQLRRSETFDGA
jgi:hypothetical protein